jgi:hypothetical protein
MTAELLKICLFGYYYHNIFLKRGNKFLDTVDNISASTIFPISSSSGFSSPYPYRRLKFLLAVGVFYFTYYCIPGI